VHFSVNTELKQSITI